MKRLIVLFITICSLPVYTLAQQTIKLVDGSVVDSLLETIPQRDVQVSGDSICVTYYFNNVLSQTDPLYPTAKILRIDGFGNNSEIYEPSYLFREDTFTIPDSTSYHIEIVDSDYIEIPLILAPSRPILAENTYDTYTTDNVPPINAFSGYFPSNLIINTEIDCYRGTPLLMVRICPVQYNYYQQKVRIYRRISYVISNTDNRGNTRSNSDRSQGNYYDTFLGNTTLNYQYNTSPLYVTPGIPTLLPTEDYLIVSVPQYSTAVNKLAEWKRHMGYNVHIALNSNWTKSTIKDYISTSYDTLNNLKHLLIIGNNSNVPAEESIFTYSNNNKNEQKVDTIRYLTDLHYALITNNESHIPDAYIGRLPVNSLQEADIVVDKIIMYEKNPTVDNIYYNNGLHCSYFQDNPHDNKPRDGYEDVRFTLTSEEIRNYVMMQNKTINRVYSANTQVNPTHWNNDFFSLGEEIPEDLKRPYFQWDGNADSIINYTNAGVFYILYRDHGWANMWQSPSFDINHINYLNNTDLLPVVFSICCHTGALSENDFFAQKFLTKQNGGCVAIFAASDMMLSGCADALIEGMMDAIWPNPGLVHKFKNSNTNLIPLTYPIYSLGPMLVQGTRRMDEIWNAPRNNKYIKDIMHLFGDPSMEIYTDTPSAFNNVSINRNTATINVSLSGEVAKITFYDRTNNNVVTYIGDSASYVNLNNHDIVVCIHEHNKIPYIDGTSIIYIQNQTVSGTQTYEADKIYVGSNVTNTESPGPVIFSGQEIKLKGKEVILNGDTRVSLGSKFEICPQ